MEGKEGKSKGDEDKKLGAILDRYDALLPKVAETRKACDSLWKSYQVITSEIRQNDHNCLPSTLTSSRRTWSG